jgi:hypothetical protein
LDLSASTFSGALEVPALGTRAVAVPLSLIDTDTDQDACEGATFAFTFAGSATETSEVGS